MVSMARVNRKRLHDLRIEKGYTQEELARIADVTLRRVADLETKSGTNPTLDTLSRIAGALGVSTAELILDND